MKAGRSVIIVSIWCNKNDLHTTSGPDLSIPVALVVEPQSWCWKGNNELAFDFYPIAKSAGAKVESKGGGGAHLACSWILANLKFGHFPSYQTDNKVTINNMLEVVCPMQWHHILWHQNVFWSSNWDWHPMHKVVKIVLSDHWTI